MKRLMLIIIAIMILTGCATTEKYEAILNSWVGSDINDLMRSWGYPVGSFQAPNGNTVYVYSSSNSVTTPIRTYSFNNVLTTTGGQTLDLWCRTFFEIDSSKKIVLWRWEGNNCFAE